MRPFPVARQKPRRFGRTPSRINLPKIVLSALIFLEVPRVRSGGLVLWFIRMVTYSSGVPNPARPSILRDGAKTLRLLRRPYGPPQRERIRKRIYEMLHLVRG